MAETKLCLKEINLRRYLSAGHKDMMPGGTVQTTRCPIKWDFKCTF